MAASIEGNLFKEVIQATAGARQIRTSQFQFLPGYADYLLANKVDRMSAEQYRLSKKLNIPILQYFTHLSEDQMMERGRTGIRKLLTAVSQQKTTAYIVDSVNSWVNNQMVEISRNQIVSDDITLLSFIRRKIFRDSLADFTQDVSMATLIMRETDDFLTELERVLYKTLFAIQQQMHEQAQHISHIGNWLWDLKNNSIAWSKELFRIYELEPQERITYDLAAFNHPDDVDRVAETMRISRETLAPHDFYYRILLASGREKYLHARGQVLTDEQGQPEKIFGTLQDVTEQKRVERVHRDYENFVQKITDLTPSLITVYNIQSGEYLFVSQAISTLLGYSPDEALEKGLAFFFDLLHPDDVERIQNENSAAIAELNALKDPEQSGQIREFTYRLRHKNGEYSWFQTYGSVFERDKDNNIEKIINISNDISERILNKSLLFQKSEEIERQEDRYYKMIDEVEDYAILLLTKEGLIENWNKGAEKIKGYAADEIIGRHLRTFYTKEDVVKGVPESLIKEAADNGRSGQEGWRVRKDGSRFWASVVITALHDNSGNLSGFSKVTRDLTQKKLAEENLKTYTLQLEQKNEKLRQQNDELEAFTYIASHDLKEPLRKIKLWSNRLEEISDTPENIKSGLSKIRDACSRMQALIESLLKYTQAETIMDSSEPVDLNIILDEVLQDFAEQLQEREAIVERSRLPALSVVPVQIQQLFANIVSNAIKYAKTDIPLTIKIEMSVVGDSQNPSIRYYEIAFADNGIGFKQDYAEKIFEMFQRLDSAKDGGTGIGLAICRKIAQNHGGDIRASSTPGIGTTFYVRLPLQLQRRL
jgi:PAS domain S-box-containing protein